MKIDAFLFLQRSDIAHFATRAADFAGVPQIFIDPGLLEAAIQQGLSPTTFDYRPLDVGRHFQARITTEALTRASAIDQSLTRERERLFGAGLWQGWDQEPLRLLLIRALTAQRLGEICTAAFPEPSIGLFRPTLPQQFYFDSFLATDLFADASPRWRIVDHYSDVANWVANSNAMCFDFEQVRRRVEAGRAHAVTHIPTCYAHLQHYSTEIARAFPSNIDLPSAFWDIPVRRDHPMLLPVATLPDEYVNETCLTYRERARRVLERQLDGLIPGRAALAAQVDLLAERCFIQAVNYQGLSRALRGTNPHFVVTDHDTGSNGPLFSLAHGLGAPITVLPHASYPAAAVPHPVKVRMIERAGMATPARSVLGERVSTHGVRMGKRVAHVERHRAATVCLLLNTLFSQGLSHVDLLGMAGFHAALARLCARRGVTLLVRLKPNGAGVTTAANALGVSTDALDTVLRAPLEEVAALTDLCVSYGEPTTAGIEFLASGSLLMHTGAQCWPNDHLAAPPYIGDGTVPSFDDAHALVEIESLLNDEAEFRRRMAAQAAGFTARLVGSDDRIFPDT